MGILSEFGEIERDLRSRIATLQAQLAAANEVVEVLGKRNKALETFIDDHGSYNDGCGCCGTGSNVRQEYERDPDIGSTAKAIAALASQRKDSVT